MNTLALGCGSSASAVAPTSVDAGVGLTVAMNVVNDPSFGASVDARYRRSPQCPTEKVADNCNYTPPCDTTGMTAKAGMITVSGKQMAMLEPSADKSYRGMTFADDFADPGQMVRFQASGDEVPAHVGVAVMPVSVQVISPQLSWQFPLDRTRDFSLTWMPSNTASFDVVVSTNDAAGSSLGEVDCSFTDSAGEGTIPQTVLARLAAISSSQQAYVSVNRINWTVTKVGSWTISLGAGSGLTVPVVFE